MVAIIVKPGVPRRSWKRADPSFRKFSNNLGLLFIYAISRAGVSGKTHFSSYFEISDGAPRFKTKFKRKRNLSARFEK